MQNNLLCRNGLVSELVRDVVAEFRGLTEMLISKLPIVYPILNILQKEESTERIEYSTERKNILQYERSFILQI